MKYQTCLIFGQSIMTSWETQLLIVTLALEEFKVTDKTAPVEHTHNRDDKITCLEENCTPIRLDELAEDLDFRNWVAKALTFQNYSNTLFLLLPTLFLVCFPTNTKVVNKEPPL